MDAHKPRSHWMWVLQLIRNGWINKTSNFHLLVFAITIAWKPLTSNQKETLHFSYCKGPASPPHRRLGIARALRHRGRPHLIPVSCTLKPASQKSTAPDPDAPTEQIILSNLTSAVIPLHIRIWKNTDIFIAIRCFDWNPLQVFFWLSLFKSSALCFFSICLGVRVHSFALNIILIPEVHVSKFSRYLQLISVTQAFTTSDFEVNQVGHVWFLYPFSDP